MFADSPTRIAVITSLLQAKQLGNKINTSQKGDWDNWRNDAALEKRCRPDGVFTPNVYMDVSIGLDTRTRNSTYKTMHTRTRITSLVPHPTSYTRHFNGSIKCVQNDPSLHDADTDCLQLP